MKRLLILGWLILAASVVGQVDHAPTVAQCQADQRLWISQMRVPTGSRFTLPVYDVMIERTREMADCQAVDPHNRWRYYNVYGEIWGNLQVREQKFLDRHQMWEKFIAEDAAGKR